MIGGFEFMKKALCMLIAASVMTISLTACNQAGKQVDSDTKGDKQKPVTINRWTGSQFVNEEYYIQQLERFKKKYPWITVNTIVRDGDRVADFIVAAAAGTAPDQAPVSLPMLSKYVGRELLAPIDEYWEKWDESKAFDKDAVNTCKVDGKLYGVPGDAYLMGIVYNKKLFKEAGIEHPPTTWDELLEQSRKLTDASKQQAGFGLLIAQWVDWWFEYFVWQAGGDLTKRNSDGTVTATFTDPAVIKAAEFYRTLKREKVIQSDQTLDDAALKKSFAAGKIGMTIGNIGKVDDYLKLGMKKDDIGFAMFPKGPAGRNPSQYGGSLLGVNAASSKEVQEAVFLLNSFVSSKEEQIEKYKSEEARGKASIRLSPRTDLDQMQYQPSLAGDKEFFDILNSARNNIQLEYYAKANAGKYVDAAIQKTTLYENVDIVEELTKAQELAQKEGLAEFNRSITGGN